MQNNYFENNCNVNYCAIAGATAFFAGIRNAVILVNGSKFCYLQMLQHLGYCFRENLKNRIYCTEITESNIIFGNEKSLKRQLFLIKSNQNPSIIFIQNNCSASLIGDDLAGIAEAIGFECPVICLDSGGIQGNFFDGYNLAAEKFFDVIKLKKPLQKKSDTINIIGVTEGYYNFYYDKKELNKLLTMGNVKILNYLSYDVNLEKITDMLEACLNVVIHPELGEKMAIILYERYQIPYIVLSPPYGFEGSKFWLSSILEILGRNKVEINKIANKFDKNKETCDIDIYKLRKSIGEIWIEEINIAGPSSIVLGLAEALRKEFLNYREMHLYMHNIFNTSLVNNSYYHIHQYLNVGHIDIEDNGYRSMFLFGSFNERMLLNREKIGYCCITYPCYGYASFGPLMGIDGSRRILEKLWQYFIDFSINKRVKG